MRIDGCGLCCSFSMFKTFLKWYKNGRRGNGGLIFACAREKVRQVALLPTTKYLFEKI